MYNLLNIILTTLQYTRNVYTECLHLTFPAASNNTLHIQIIQHYTRAYNTVHQTAIIPDYYTRYHVMTQHTPPGTSKSQMLQYVYNLVPRGQYTSGKGSSATGLTAYITRDPETKQVVLQTG